MTIEAIILGCGSSGGVPRVGAGWGACDPNEPRNQRRRCSLLIERRSREGVTRVLVDTSPDLREQLLDAEVDSIDAVLFTHAHADHTHGIDDLRPLSVMHRKRIEVWADAATSVALRSRFSYCFSTPVGSEYPPILRERRLEPGRAITVEGAGGPVTATPFVVEHGSMPALGFRFGDLAYTPDVSSVPGESRRFVEDLEIWIVDALRHMPHPSHFSLAEALLWIAQLKPQAAILTNMHSDLDYNRLLAELPPGVVPAHDGLRIEFTDRAAAPSRVLLGAR
jgi:phosphoribosyl 1,2-cyclic phosphate phosphodiesterase